MDVANGKNISRQQTPRKHRIGLFDALLKLHLRAASPRMPIVSPIAGIGTFAYGLARVFENPARSRARSCLSVSNQEESAMSLKGGIWKFLQRRCMLATIILSTSVSYTSSYALAQEALPLGLGINGRSTPLSFEEPAPVKAPYLVIGMADRWNTSQYGSSPTPGNETMNSSADDALTPRISPSFSMDRANSSDSVPLVVSSLSIRRPDRAATRRTVRTSSELVANFEVFTLLKDQSVPGSFLYGPSANDRLQTESIADNEIPTHEIDQAPKPLLQLEFTNWKFPVMLSGTTVSR